MTLTKDNVLEYIGTLLKEHTPSASFQQVNRDIAPIISPARYAKGMLKAVCKSPDEYKTRAARLAGSLSRERYSGREHAYIMSPTKATKLAELWVLGWDASAVTGELYKPPS